MARRRIEKSDASPTPTATSAPEEASASAKPSKAAKPLPPAVAEARDAVLTLVTAFCDARLDADYKRVCKKLVERMAKEDPSPFARGRHDIWAAGIVYAVGSMNFLFDKSATPHVRASEIDAHFGVAAGGAAQKAALLRERYDLSPFNDKYLVGDMRDKMSGPMDALQQLVAMMTGQETSADSGLLTLSGFDQFGGIEKLTSRKGRGGKPSRTDGEFVDADHPVMDAYYQCCEDYETGRAPERIEADLHEIINADLDFYDSYLMLRGVLQERGADEEADVLLETAYNRAIARVPDKKGKWPPRLEWMWLENRHILRLFDEKSIALWEAGDTESAVDVMRRILSLNPGDNTGARYNLLALRKGMTLEQWEDKFAHKSGLCLDAAKMARYFDRESAKFPDDFHEWRQAAEAMTNSNDDE